MRLSSILVDRCSETRIRVPSDRTTFSSGVIKNANGRLLQVNTMASQATKARGGHLRQSLDDHECDIGFRGDSTFLALYVVLR